ncbi:hypothetical protein AYL99_11404 [Fonsecaea erecta]|uniref:Uncharacterized protein n=1 Tax=Fonsecaea erecta TaxID=1367422 RepID=A0A178Z546_9EURO|nr:hypothetical protein AYL99_11404 [Fonsecaea erecta]OAP54303.1 hypothetical protein AYL99_11404 [Fonsecaea erecta]
MAAELIWTIIFGLTATLVGLVTIWQNFRGVHVEVAAKADDDDDDNGLVVSKRSQPYRTWYGWGL